jgi:type IV secretion system protein VirB1
MNTADIVSLVVACAPLIHPETAQAVLKAESALNPHAIGIVGGALVRQPRSRKEAVATARMLEAGGWNFSVGLAQINVRNFERLRLDLEGAFAPCANLSAMQTLLLECFDRAPRTSAHQQLALRRALSCYYSGNFTTGFDHGYVTRVIGLAVPGTGAPAKPP